jgi:hypothetical protein
MAQFVIRSIYGGEAAIPTPSPVAAFTDVPITHPLYRYIQEMRRIGITRGCSPTAYCPDQPVTRGQMSVFIIRALHAKNLLHTGYTPEDISRDSSLTDTFAYTTAPYFTDVAANDLFLPYIQRMRDLGITAGCGPTTFCPNDPNTRGQISVFLARGLFVLWNSRPADQVPPNALTFGAGKYFVGKDIPAGRYYTVPAGGGGCYWERLSGLGGSLGDIIANDFLGAGFAQAIVDIATSDLAFSTDADCGTWFTTPRLGFQPSIPSGTWLVGAQIAPGTYRANAKSGCYWERLRNFSGSLSGIIANNFVSNAGPEVVSIVATDIGFTTDGDCGVWTRVSNQLVTSHSAETRAEVKQNWLMKRSNRVRLQRPRSER